MSNAHILLYAIRKERGMKMLGGDMQDNTPMDVALRLGMIVTHTPPDPMRKLKRLGGTVDPNDPQSVDELGFTAVTALAFSAIQEIRDADDIFELAEWFEDILSQDGHSPLYSDSAH